jgi:hypothetical protein
MAMADRGFSPDEMLGLGANAFSPAKEFEKWIRSSSLNEIFPQNVLPFGLFNLLLSLA